MAEVGVLNLTIKDNSEKAGQGLRSLADALSAVKTALEGFNLSPVGEQVVALRKTITENRAGTLVKNLGTMFNAINQFSKIKSFTIDTDKIRSMAENMLKLADAKDRVEEAARSGAGVSDWRSGMMGISNATKDTVTEVTEQTEKLDRVLTSFQRRIGKDAPLQIFGGRGTKKSEGQIAMDLPELQKQTDGLVEVQSHIEKTTESMDGLNESVANMAGPVKALDLDKYIGTPLESIYNKVVLGGTAMERFWDTFAIKAPSQSVAAMEKAVAGNASMARQEIKSLIDALDKPIKYKGLSEFINVKTGVTGSSQGGNIINENTTMLGALLEEQEALERTKSAISETTDAQVKLNEAGRAYAGVITVFDEASGSFKRMYADTSKVQESVTEAKAQTEDSVSSIKNFIDLTKVPASGKNGVFANAAEEVSYLTSKVEEAKLGMQQFDSIEKNAAKQMKHGGPMKPDELAFNLQHATEGFYQYAEAEQHYQRAIDDALDHANKYVSEMSQMADQSAATEPLKAAVDQLGATAKNTSSDGLEAFKNELQDIANSTEPALSKIELLQNKVGFLQEKLSRLYQMPATDELGQDTGRNNAINETLLQIGRVNEQIQKLIDKSHEAQQALQFENMKASAADEISQRTPWTAEDVSNVVNYYSQIELLEMKLNGMQDALARDIEANKLDTQQISDRVIAIQNLKDKIEELKNAQDETTESTKTFGLSFKDFKKNLKSAFPLLSQLGSRLKNIIIRRTLTAALRKIVSGAKEGLQNVYEYSKAVGTSFAPAMDSAASSLATMKNALGAALAPAVQALIPVLQTLVNWFIDLVNQVNQFFSLLNGQSTWTRATQQSVSAFSKQETAAKKTGAAIKDLLADWDELNIIQSNTSGAGSGAGTSAAEDFLKMFEEVSVFDNEIKDTVNWVKDNIKLIEGVATSIGAAILGWKLSNALLSGVGELRSLSLEGIGIAVGLQLTWSGAYDAGLNGGFDTASLLTTASGILMTTISAALIGWNFGGPWGAVIGAGAGLIVSLAVALSAYYDGERTKKLRDKWGKLTLTQEQIDELVDREVTATVKAEIDIVDASVNTRMNARIKANGAILKFSQSLQSARFALEAGSDPASINTALTSAQEAIKEIQTELESSKEGLALSFTSFKYTDKEGNDVTKKLYSSLSKGENALDTFFSDLGKDIAKLISKGFDEGLSDEEQLMALNLMETLQRVTNQAERNYEMNKLVRDSQHEMENVYSLETAEGVFNAQQERLDQYKQTRYNQIKEDLEDRHRELEYYKAIQDVYKERGDTAKVEEYAGYIKDSLTAIDNLDKAIEEMENGTYKWDLDEMYIVMYKNMQEGWKNKLTEWFRQGVYDSIFNEKESPFENNPIARKIMEQFGLNSSVTLSDKDIEDIVSKIKELYPVEGNEAMSQLLALGHLLKYLPGERGNAKVRDEFDLIKNVDFEKIVESFINFDITPENYKQLIDRFWEYIFTDPARDAKDAMNESVQEWTPPAKNALEEAEEKKPETYHIESPNVEVEESINPYTGYPKDWLAKQMELWFPDSNADLLHRKVLEEAGNIETIISETVAASMDGSKGIPWEQDLVVNFATITPDGRKLDENEFNEYVDSLFENNKAIEDIINADKTENGGLGLYLNSYYGQDLQSMIDAAVEDAIKLHYMQEEYYGKYGNTGKYKAARFSANNMSVDMGAFTNKYDTNPSDPYLPSAEGYLQLRQQAHDTVNELNADNMTKAVETGATNANRDQNDILNSIMRGVEALLRKEWTVNVSPSSDWGNHNAKSGQAWYRVIGG